MKQAIKIIEVMIWMPFAILSIIGLIVYNGTQAGYLIYRNFHQWLAKKEN